MSVKKGPSTQVDDLTVGTVADLPPSEENHKGLLSQYDPKDIDKAAQFLAEHGPYAPMTAEQEKVIKHKIDSWMLPLLTFTTTLGAIDKVELATAALYDFRSDNGLVGDQYNWCSSILSIGMIVGMFPMTYVAHRMPTAKTLAVCSVLWSAMTMLMSIRSGFRGIMTLRFVMGFLEAMISPSYLLIAGNFWTPSEQPWRLAIISSATSSVFNGFWSWVVGNISEQAPLARWQYLFLLTGTINVAWSFFVLVYLPDSPMNAHFLSTEEKYHALTRVAKNKIGVENHKWKWSQAAECFVDAKFWTQFLFNICINISNGALINFSPIIVKGLGYTAQTSALIGMPNGVLSTLSSLFFSYVAGQWTNRRCLCVILACIPPLVGTAMVYALPRSNMAGQLIGLYLMYFYWGPYATAQTLPVANTAGHTKRAVMFNMLHIGYGVGNMVGPQTFTSSQAPKYTAGITTSLVTFCLGAGFMAMYWVVGAWQNRAKDNKYGPVPPESEEVQELVQELLDKTDVEQPHFRYIT